MSLRSRLIGSSWGLLAALALFAATSASGANITWIGGNAQWDDGAGNDANWNPADEPDSNDAAIFNTNNCDHAGNQQRDQRADDVGEFRVVAQWPSVNRRRFDLADRLRHAVGGCGGGGRAQRRRCDDRQLSDAADRRGNDSILDRRRDELDLHDQRRRTLLRQWRRFDDRCSGRGYDADQQQRDDHRIESVDRYLHPAGCSDLVILSHPTPTPASTWTVRWKLASLTINRNQTLDIDIPLSDIFNGSMAMSHESKLDIASRLDSRRWRRDRRRQRRRERHSRRSRRQGDDRRRELLAEQRHDQRRSTPTARCSSTRRSP